MNPEWWDDKLEAESDPLDPATGCLVGVLVGLVLILVLVAIFVL